MSMACDSEVVSREFEPSKAPVVSFSKEIYPCCLVLVGTRNLLQHNCFFHTQTCKLVAINTEPCPLCGVFHGQTNSVSSTSYK